MGKIGETRSADYTIEVDQGPRCVIRSPSGFGLSFVWIKKKLSEVSENCEVFRDLLGMQPFDETAGVKS